VETHFNGNWREYWNTPDYIVRRIRKFKDLEAKVARKTNG